MLVVRRCDRVSETRVGAEEQRKTLCSDFDVSVEVGVQACHVNAGKVTLIDKGRMHELLARHVGAFEPDSGELVVRRWDRLVPKCEMRAVTRD
jgi:hypothetical protein